MLKKIVLMTLLLGISIEGATMWLIPVTYSYSKACPTDKPFFGRGFAIEIRLLQKCTLLPDGTEDKDCFEKNKKAEEDYYANHCFPCDHDEPMLIEKNHEKDFDRCQNRIIIQGYSVLKKECPSDKPIQTYDGKCIACDELNGQLIQDCSICPNTMMSQSGRCYLCDTKAIAGFTEEECQKCADTRLFSQETLGWAGHVDFCKPKKSPIEGRPLMTYGEIFDLPLEDTYYIIYVTCDTPNIIKTDHETCDLCPERIFTGNYCVLKEFPLGEKCDTLKNVLAPKEVCDLCPNRTWNDRSCTISECPIEAPLRNKGGDCEPCGAIHMVEKASDCNVCPYMKAIQHGDNYYCELDCPAEKPLKTRKGCKPCDDDYVIMYDQETCDLCPNREYKDGKCLLKENK